MFKYSTKVHKSYNNKKKLSPKHKISNVSSRSGWTSKAQWIVAKEIKIVRLYNNSFQCTDEYISKENVEDWKNALRKCNKFINLTAGIKIVEHPFQVCVVQNFLKDEHLIEDLLDDINKINWKTNKMDLYEFYQSPDLSTTTLPYLDEFYQFLTIDVKKLMTDLTGFNITRVSATCSMYNSTNFLLPHDDLIGDRLIAFVFYISPWKLAGKDFTDYEKNVGWSSSMGGELQLFAIDENYNPTIPVVNIPPANNQFLFFKVGRNTYHQVTEVLSDDYSRISINGWFHGTKSYQKELIIKNIPTIFNNFRSKDYDIENWLNSKYYHVKIIDDISRYFEKQSEISLTDFLIEDKYNTILSILKHDKVEWYEVGPVHIRKYDVANLSQEVVKKISDFFASSSFLKLLNKYTNLDLCESDDPLIKNKTIEIEIQRWSRGCYSIYDATKYNKDELDAIIYFGCEDNARAGTMNYLDPEDSNQDEVLLSLYPKNNALNLVFRTSGTASFTKYINHKIMEDNTYFYIITAKYNEISSG